MAAEILQMSSLLANMRCGSMVVMGNPQCYYGNVQQSRRVLCCKNGFVFSPQYCRCMPANFGKSLVQLRKKSFCKLPIVHKFRVCVWGGGGLINKRNDQTHREMLNVLPKIFWQLHFFLFVNFWKKIVNNCNQLSIPAIYFENHSNLF